MPRRSALLAACLICLGLWECSGRESSTAPAVIATSIRVAVPSHVRSRGVIEMWKQAEGGDTFSSECNHPRETSRPRKGATA